MNKRVKRFFKYSLVGISTFLIDLFLLWFFTSYLGIQYLVSTSIAFLVGVTINYFVGRKIVFKETARAVGQGYMYFLAIVSFGIISTLAVMYGIVNYTHLNIITARIITSGFIGIFNFLMNDIFNFKIKS